MRLVEHVAGDALHELVVGNGIAIAQNHGGDLRVEDRMRDQAGPVPDDFNVLARGVKDFHDALVRHQGEEGREVEAGRERIDHHRFVGARHLRDAELRVIGRFPQELGVDGHEGMPRQALASFRQFLGRGDGMRHAGSG